MATRLRGLQARAEKIGLRIRRYRKPVRHAGKTFRYAMTDQWGDVDLVSLDEVERRLKVKERNFGTPFWDGLGVPRTR